MTISTAKTEVQCIPPVKKPLELKIKGENLKQTTDFVYQGGKVSELETSDADIDRRISLATGVFQGVDKHLAIK